MTGYHKPVIDAIRVLQMTGARLREVLNMEWSFVDLPNGQVYLQILKREKRRSSLAIRLGAILLR